MYLQKKSCLRNQRISTDLCFPYNINTKEIALIWDHLSVQICTIFRNETLVQLRKLLRKTTRNQIVLCDSGIRREELFRLNIAYCYYVASFITGFWSSERSCKYFLQYIHSNQYCVFAFSVVHEIQINCASNEMKILPLRNTKKLLKQYMALEKQSM